MLYSLMQKHLFEFDYINLSQQIKNVEIQIKKIEKIEMEINK